MTLHDVFERVVVLNLPYKPERKARLAANLLATGIADPEKVVWQKAISGDWMRPPAWWNAGNGAWGCCFSHVSVLATAIMDEVESVLVLEDDAIFDVRSPDRLESLYKEWPDKWGQIYLGGQHLGEEPAAVGKNWLLAHNVNRTHAYAVHKSTMSDMAAHCLYSPDYQDHSEGWHIDHQLGIAHERQDWKVWAPRWWLAGQAADKSNISGQETREMWWQRVPDKAKVPLVVLPPELKNTDDLYQNFCHAGYNLFRDTCEDVGANRALTIGGALTPYLGTIRSEALSHHRLPCVQHEGYTSAALKKIWRGPVVRPTLEEIPALHAEVMEHLYREALR